MQKPSKRRPVSRRAPSKTPPEGEIATSYRRGLFREGFSSLFYPLVDHLPIGLAVAMHNGDLLYANHRFLEMIGSGHKVAAPTNLKSFIEAGSWIPLEQAMCRACLEPTEGRVTITGPGDRQRTIEVSLSPFAQIPSAVKIVASDTTALANAEYELKRTKDSMISLNARVLQLQDEERRRLARDLHDTVGQEIVVALMALDTIARTWRNPDPSAQGSLAEAIDWLRKVESEIRTFSYLLHPPLLDDMGLGSALSWYTEGLSKRSGVSVELSLPESLPRLSLPVETALFRVTQESLSNVIRHSQSKKAWVEITLAQQTLMLTVRDNGRGFDTAAHSGAAPVGVGIEGMRGRLNALGGMLDVHSGLDGTEVTATVPLSDAETVWEVTSTPQQLRHRREAKVAAGATRILIVDDHEVARKGIRFLISEENDLEICGEAQNGQEAFEKAQQLAPDLIILDLNMSGGGGFSAANRIRNAGLTPKILIYTTHTFIGLERIARAASCDGFVVKSNATKDLIRGIRAVLRGEEFYSSLNAAAQGA